MVKYLFQRFLIGIAILSLVITIGGLFIDGFYTYSYDNATIISNVEATYNQVNPKNTIDHDKLGRYVQVKYTDENGNVQKEFDFYEYNNLVSKTCGNDYNQLKEYHIYIKLRVWLVVLLIILTLTSSFLIIPICLNNMNLDYDYDDEYEISRFRLDIFCWWSQFIGYSKNDIDKLYESELQRINSQGRHCDIKPYKELRKKLKNINS